MKSTKTAVRNAKIMVRVTRDEYIYQLESLVKEVNSCAKAREEDEGDKGEPRPNMMNRFLWRSNCLAASTRKYLGSMGRLADAVILDRFAIERENELANIQDGVVNLD